MPHAHPWGKAVRLRGYRYKSKFEGEIGRLMTEAGIEFQYEPADKRVPYHMEHVYHPDFLLPHGVLVEAKGFLDAVDRRKLLRVKQEHPELDLRLLFQRSTTRISRALRSLTYAEWADRHGFLWAQGPEIPKSWLLDGSGEKLSGADETARIIRRSPS